MSEAIPTQGRAERHDGERGYVVLAAMLIGAVMLIGTTVAVTNLVTEGRREREAELVWRGEQITRGIRLYYQKTGRFPQKLEDMAEPKNQFRIRFLRKMFKDPMNRKDGTWRFIYVGPSGELIGSLTRTAALQIGGLQRPGAPFAGVGTVGGAIQGERPSMVTPLGAAGGGIRGSAPTNPQPFTTLSRPGGDGTIIGGNIIGVGSKEAKTSIRIYKGGETYKTWEFIWDPLAAPVGVGQPIAVPQGGLPGTQPGPRPQPRRP